MGLIPGQMINFYNSNGDITKTIPAEELSFGSNKRVKVKCDYCGKEKTITYNKYNKNTKKQTVPYACCNKCAVSKYQDTCMERYGVKNVFQDEEIKLKQQQTCMEKYGVKNQFQAKEVKEKCKETMLERYGAEHTLTSPILKKKFCDTMNDRYGVSYSGESVELLEKRNKTCLQKYGTTNPMQNPDIQKKVLSTLSQNGKLGSPEEKEIASMLRKFFPNLKTSVPLDRCILDIEIEINGIKINIECDGYYWHCKTLEDKTKDQNRDSYLHNNGYDKTLRIVYNRKLPSEEEILQAINELVNSDKKFKRIWSPDITEEQIEHFNNL